MPLFTSDKDRRYAMLGLRIVGDFGVAIAVPVILFVLGGQWLDNKYQKSPWFTILAFVLAALLSARMIYKKAKAYGKEFQNMDTPDDKKDSSTGSL